jgi:hypothetical protein
MKSLLALIVLIPAAWSQEKPGLKARELFYTPAPEAPKTPEPPAPPKAGPKAPAKSKTVPVAKADTHTVATTVPLGLRYAMLKRDDAGKFVEVDPDTTFRTGDRIRIQVDANTSGYLYIVTQGSSGNWTLLLPSKEVAGGSNHVQKGESRLIPSGDRGQFKFEEPAGAEKVFIVLSRQPEPDLDKLIYSVGGSKNATTERSLVAQAAVGNDVVSRLRGTARDLVFEKVDSASPATNGKLENAVYVANPSTAADARLVTDLVLKHR